MNERDSVSILRGMLQIPSESTHERILAEYLAATMASLGMQSTVDNVGNAVGVTSGDVQRSDGATRDIVLLGHMDTVPGRIAVRTEGDRLYGRGAVDAKGPLAAFLIASAGLTLPAGVRIVIIGAVEEEIATSRGARAVAARYAPTTCVIGEPSGWDAVTLGYKGRLLTEYSLDRGVAHTAGPDGSAADACLAWWNSVVAGAAMLTSNADSIFDRVQTTVRAMRTESDGVCERVFATLGFRLPPGVGPSRVEQLCREHAGDARLEFRGHEVAILADRHTPLVRSLTASIREEGARPRLLRKTGTSDMNVVAPAWRCPIAAYGPGDSSLDHTPHEHILISEYLRGIRVLRRALQTLADTLAVPDGVDAHIADSTQHRTSDMPAV
jgi:[amino group carrier protein]-lysine/ornithine hydrolase